jgi:hypothetical protein
VGAEVILRRNAHDSDAQSLGRKFIASLGRLFWIAYSWAFAVFIPEWV